MPGRDFSISSLFLCIYSILYLLCIFHPSLVDANSELKPQVHAQATLIEDWYQPDQNPQNFSKVTSLKVVITVSQLNVRINSFSPFSNQSVYIQCNETTLPVILEKHGRLISSTLEHGKIYQFNPNAFGRISFSIPISEDGKMSFLASKDNHTIKSLHLPPLFLQTSFMKQDEWIAIHPDFAIFDSLSNLQPSTLSQLAPSLSNSHAASVSQMINKLTAQALKASPLMSSTHLNGRQKRWLLDRNHKYNQLLWQDDESNFISQNGLLSTFHIPSLHHASNYHRQLSQVSPTSESWSFVLDISKSHPEIQYYTHSNSHQSTSRRMTRRSPLSSHHPFLVPRNWNSWLSMMKNGTLETISSLNQFLATSAQKLEVSSQDHQGGLVVFLQDIAGKVKRWIVQTVSQIAEVVKRLLELIGVETKPLLERIRSFFSWTSIVDYTNFLIHYHKSTIPLTPKLIDAKRSFLNSLMLNASLSAHKFMNTYANHFGGNITFSRLPSILNEKMTSLPSISPTITAQLRQSVPPIEGTVATDMLINNIHQATIESNPTTLKEFQNISSNLIKELHSQGIFAEPIFSKLKETLVTFKADTNILDKGISYLFAILTSIFNVIFSSAVKTIELVLKLIPLIHSYMLKITGFKLYIPLFYEFYTSVISRQTHEFNIFNILNLLGAIHNVAHIKLFRSGEAITSEELKVLLSESNPMFYKIAMRKATHLGPWTKEREHRVDTFLDWGPRGMLMFLTSLSVYLGYGFQGQKMHVNVPVKLFHAVVTWMMVHTIFPIEQVRDTAPSTVANALYNVNNPWFTWYTAWTTNVIVKQIAILHAFVPPKTLSNKWIYPVLEMFLGVPQSIAILALLNTILPITDWTDPKRTIIGIANAGSWIFDSLSYFMYTSDSKYGKAVDYTMLAFYQLRFTSMVAFDKVGVAMDPAPLWSDDINPSGSGILHGKESHHN